MKIYEHENTRYTEVNVQDLFKQEDELLQKIAKVASKFKDDGACVYNAKLSAEATGSECVEGFVIIMGNGYPGAIRHCWNKLGDIYFDVTRDMLWAVTRPESTNYYFPLETFNPEVYKNSYSFQSDVVKLAGDISKNVNNEAKKKEDYNYISFFTEDQ